MPAHSFPWYDSLWLSAYVEAKEIIRRECPNKLSDFEHAMSGLQAPADFEVQKIRDVLDPVTLNRVRKIISEMQEEQCAQHEVISFGRLVVQDHPEFSEIQRALTHSVSELVGEAVQPCYNFLSLYNNLGVCDVHMDTPMSKWTLDICIEQSGPWPIKFSQCVPWPEGFEQTQDDWHAQIINNPALQFQSYTLQENQAIIFCGSNQWHYRDRIPRVQKDNFCHLLFLHYMPENCEALLNPAVWSRLFDIPELSSLTGSHYDMMPRALNPQEGVAGNAVN